MPINAGSLTKMLAPQEGMNTVMSAQDDDTLTLVDILDQSNKPPEAKHAQDIVDMFDFVRRYEKTHPK
jgi:hypothetical protein